MTHESSDSCVFFLTRELPDSRVSTGNSKMKQHQDGETEILWGSLDVATRRTSLSRGTLYNLIADGLIRSRVIRRKHARGAGHRLIDLRSLDEFIENSPSDVTDEVRERNRAAAIAMTKAKQAKHRERHHDSRQAAARRAQKETKAA